MKRLLPVVTACLLILFVSVLVTHAAVDTQSAALRPGECNPNVTYTQRFQFMPTAFDVNEYLLFINDYHGCDVKISQGPNPNVGADGFYIWYKLPPIASTK